MPAHEDVLQGIIKGMTHVELTGDVGRRNDHTEGFPALIDGLMEKAMFDMEFGDAAEMAVTVAREKGADAIVIGKRGLSGVEEFLLGSVSSKVAQLSPVPVIIVK